MKKAIKRVSSSGQDLVRRYFELHPDAPGAEDYRDEDQEAVRESLKEDLTGQKLPKEEDAGQAGSLTRDKEASSKEEGKGSTKASEENAGQAVREKEKAPSSETVKEKQERAGENRPKNTKKTTSVGVVLLRKFIFMISLGVFAYASVRLVNIFYVYAEGESAYVEVIDQAHSGKKVEPTPASGETPAGSRDVEPETREPETQPIPATPEELAAKRLATTEDIYPFEDEINHELMAKTNAHYAGWIYIPGVGIEYPMVQGADNSHYLRYTFDNRENIAGAIFISCNVDKKLTGFNTTIYGHNQKNGKMFAPLLEFKNPDKLEENPYIYIILPDGKSYQYEIFAVCELPPSGDQYRINQHTKSEKWRTITAILESPGVHRDLGVNENDHIITLVTCTDDAENRVCVFAVCNNWHE